MSLGFLTEVAAGFFEGDLGVSTHSYGLLDRGTNRIRPFDFSPHPYTFRKMAKVEAKAGIERAVSELEKFN